MTTEKPQLNTELFEKIKQKITENPEGLDMNKWRDRCGTVMCIAGWACVLSGEDIMKVKYIPYVGAKLLGISFNEDFLTPTFSGVVPRIFIADTWPSDLRTNYRHAITPAQRAEITCRAIDRYIADPEEF